MLYLVWLLAARRNLLIDATLHNLDLLPRNVRMPYIERHHSLQHAGECAVAVRLGAFLLSELAVQEPSMELLVLLVNADCTSRAPSWRATVQDRGGVQNASIPLRKVNDANGSAGVRAGHDLRMVQVRAHASVRRDEQVRRMVPQWRLYSAWPE